MVNTTTKVETSFGARLRAARKKRGLAQDQLGLDLGVSKSAVSSWENGRDAPSFAFLPLIRRALRVSLDELICGEVAPLQPHAPLYVSDLVVPTTISPAVVDPAEAELLKRFRALNKKRQSALLELMR